MQFIVDGVEVPLATGAVVAYMQTHQDFTVGTAKGFFAVGYATAGRWLEKCETIPANAVFWDDVLTWKLMTKLIEESKSLAMQTLREWLPRADAIHGAAIAVLQNPRSEDGESVVAVVRFWEASILPSLDLCGSFDRFTDPLSKILENFLDAMKRKDRLGSARFVEQLLDVARELAIEVPGWISGRSPDS